MRPWPELVQELRECVRAATASGLRYRTARSTWKWEIYPREYLQLTQHFAQAPDVVREVVRELTA